MIDSELPCFANHQDLFEASLSGNDCKELDNGLKTHFMEKDEFLNVANFLSIFKRV